VFRRQIVLATLTVVLCSSALHAQEGNEWNQIEAVTEKSFQEVIGSCDEARDELANLNGKLNQYGWSLTRYTVQLLHELDADSLPQASERLNDDTYAPVALRDAMWDGFNGWSIVSSLRVETLEVLQQLEAVRTGSANVSVANVSQGEKAQLLRKALADKAQKVTERLLKEAAGADPQLNADSRPGTGRPAT
jgi:hypothetical protein